MLPSLEQPPTNLCLIRLSAVGDTCHTVPVVCCPDSGPAHMATAVHTPVVGLYATSNRHRTGPNAMDLIEVGDVKEKLDMAFAARDITPIHATTA